MTNTPYHIKLMIHWVTAFNKYSPNTLMDYKYDRDINTHIVSVDVKTFKDKKNQSIFNKVTRDGGIKFQMNIQFIPAGSIPDYVKAIRRKNKSEVANKRLKEVKYG